jgi:hypothetical protein
MVIKSTRWYWCAAWPYAPAQMKYMERSLILAAALCSGCTALETRESQAWLALHAIDTAQSIHAAQEPNCYKEKNTITRALIGEHPADGEIIAWSIGVAAVHLAVTDLLLRNDHPKIAKVWQYVRIASTTSAIINNHGVGIRIGSPNQHTESQCLSQ